MYHKTFEKLGFSPNEAKIYETLLTNAELGVSEISVNANVHRRNVYDALSRLVEKGLVFQIFQKKENLYRAVHPQKLMEMVKEQEQKLALILPELKDMYETEPMKEAAFIYKGIEGYKNYRRDLLRVGKEVCFLGAKALWLTPGIDGRLHKEFRREFEEKKISYKTIFDPRVPEQLPQAIEGVGGEYRVFPKGYETVGVVDIFGDHVVMFTSHDVGDFGEDGSIFVIINQTLADSYRKWFDFMWKHCPPVVSPKQSNGQRRYK